MTPLFLVETNITHDQNNTPYLLVLPEKCIIIASDEILNIGDQNTTVTQQNGRLSS
jgi:hypothetical protein